MELNVYNLNYLQTLGAQVNKKKCFESRDEHFTCLDHVNDPLGKISQHFSL